MFGINSGRNFLAGAGFRSARLVPGSEGTRGSPQFGAAYLFLGAYGFLRYVTPGRSERSSSLVNTLAFSVTAVA